METLTSTVSIILLLALIVVPIFLFARVKKVEQPKFHFPIFLLIGMIVTAGIILTIAWWADYSDQLLMNHYGYDFKAINKIERFESVEMENIERVKSLEIAYNGIGWPLGAIMAFIFYSPYLLIVYLIGEFTLKRKRNSKNKPITKPEKNGKVPCPEHSATR